LLYVEASRTDDLRTARVLEEIADRLAKKEDDDA
jgi:hypothetical protein